ncbi:hypothetical protein [Paraglaciecola chathamensis]|uniref:hypothetical protein n=1 Tax=Paraglaciecola chathamensis TaxID=368405 RepID=UPI0036372A95
MAEVELNKAAYHGMGRTIVFPIKNGVHETGLKLLGGRSMTKAPEQSITTIGADMDGVYMAKTGSAVIGLEYVTIGELPAGFKTKCLGFALVGDAARKVFIDDPSAYAPYGMAFAQWKDEDPGTQKIRVQIYYSIAGTTPEEAAEYDDPTGDASITEFTFTGTAQGFVGAAVNGVNRSFLEFEVDLTNPADPNKVLYDQLYTTKKIVLPSDVTAAGGRA